ncbi:MAG TPA: HD domain-containing phosphohydrolase [Longimicrobiales bacterium]
MRMIPLESDLTDARILVVDDEPANIRLLERILDRAGYRFVEATTDPREAAELFDDFRPDLVLLDLNMDPLDGFAVMDQLRSRLADEVYLPILVLTADVTPEARQRALSGGAKDFLTKPFDASEAVLRIRNLLETRQLHRRLRAQNAMLEEGVRERTRELEEARIEILECLGRAAEYRDDATGEHTRRVGELSGQIALQLELGPQEAELIRRAATLHDIGKIGIPDHILLKPGKLTPDEFEIMKTHTTIGARILSGSRSPMLQIAREIALTHHERWDGRGYAGLVGAAIPLSGRIVAVADTFDALTHKRPYKAAWPRERAIAVIDRERGRQFDAEVVDAFLRVMRRRDPGPLAARAIRV